jgi:hypothetical protein
VTRSHRPSLQNPWSDADYFEYLKGRCTVNDNGCWIHPGSQTHPRGMRPGALGYTQCTIRSRRYMTHRWMYAFVHGPIPEGHVVGHRCDTPPCCNPDHLKAMTELENAADMIAKRRNYEQQRTHCPRGHEYNEENTYILPAASGRMARNCKVCARIRGRIKAGWPEYLAASLPRQPLGFRPEPVSQSIGEKP